MGQPSPGFYTLSSLPDSPPASPEWLRPKATSELTTLQPEQILRGMLYQGCKLILMGGSKTFKTWALMDIAFCVANGLLWWGVHTFETPVVYLDFELLDFDFRWRMERICEAHGEGSIDAVKRIGLRGKAFNSGHWPIIHDYVKAEGARLVVSDPTYKLLGPYRDENAAGDIAQVTATFDHLTEETSAAVAYSQHYSKGNQADKESIDRGAGSGVWARDADSIVCMTKHEAGEDCLSIEMTLRSFPRVEPFVVRWSLPLFERDQSLDPADLKRPSKGGSDPKYGVEDLLTHLGDKELKTGEFKSLIRTETGMSERTFYSLLKQGEAQQKLHKSAVPPNRWERINQR